MRYDLRITAAVLSGLLTVLLLPHQALTAKAAKSETYGDLTYISYGGWIEITDCDQSAETVEIPAEIGGTTVRDIGDYAFSGCSDLKEIIIPDSVQHIKDQAFAYCTALEAVTLPARLRTIGFNAFHGCGFTEIMIPDTVTEIGGFAFSATPLTSFTVPQNVETIGDRVFYECSDLAVITVDAENSAFTDIDGVLFTQDQRTLLCFPPAKEDASYSVPETVDTLYPGAFYGCSNLEEIVMQYGISKIPKDAFYNCSGLRQMQLPEPVSAVDTAAFYGCTSLTEICIPKTLKTVGIGAFGQCTALTDVYYAGSEDEWEAIEIDDMMGMNSCLTDADIHFNTYFTEPIVRGDVNADGVFTVADAVLLQKWLLHTPDAVPNRWTAADFDGNGRLTAADLTLMKRTLMIQSAYPLGDVNMDGSVTAEDTGLLIWAVYHLHETGENILMSGQDMLADLDLDGSLTVWDAIMQLQYLALRDYYGYTELTPEEYAENWSDYDELLPFNAEDEQFKQYFIDELQIPMYQTMSALDAAFGTDYRTYPNWDESILDS